MLIPVNATDMLFVTVVGLAVLLLPVATEPKEILLAERLTGAMPVPERPTLCGLPDALLVTTIEAL